MRIVIATADPRGAYHLAPLHSAMSSAGAAGHHFTHLVPYPEPVQGKAWTDLSSDPRVLDRCDRVVVAGCGFTAWTELVAWRAHQLSVPVLMTELALGVPPVGRALPPVYRASAMSPVGAGVLSRYLGVPAGSLSITGTPTLDVLPSWRPRERHALLLSSADRDDRDPGGLLRQVGARLLGDGWTVTVRCHPREDGSYWSGFELDTSVSAPLAATTVQVVLGYPGSAHPMVAAVGVPVVSVVPAQGDIEGPLPGEYARVMSGVVRSVDDLDRVLRVAEPPAPQVVFDTVGPIGGAAGRVVEFWTRT